MPVTQERTLAFLEEWTSYIPRFKNLPPAAQAEFLKGQGYASFHDLLAHITAWNEEALMIVTQVVTEKDFQPKKYDLDSFNAESLARFKDISEAGVQDHFETFRRKLVDFVESHPAAFDEHRRVRSWMYGVVIEHIKEHGIGASRLVALDTLQNEWADYIGDFNSLPHDKQKAFLERQGFPRFRDLVAHVAAWWEEGLRIIRGIREDPTFAWKELDTDAFNAEAVERFGKLEQAEVFESYEKTRLVLMELINALPDDVYHEPDVEGWLKSDVIEHYFEHRI
jgi:hypothetical protein